MADLMITLWCPAQSLVRELSDRNGYILPAIFCKIGVFYTGKNVTRAQYLYLAETVLTVIKYEHFGLFMNYHFPML